MSRHQFTWTIPLVVLAGAALADSPKTTPAPLDPSTVPADCQQYLTTSGDSRSEILPWQQRISLASCRQSLELVTVDSPRAYIGMLDRIVRIVGPSLAMYRETMAAGPTPQVRMLAAHHLGMTYAGIMVRARDSVENRAGIYGGATYGSLDSHAMMHRFLEPLLVGYRVAATEAFREVVRLADENPADANANHVMVFVVANARNQLTEIEAPATTISSQ